VFYKLAYDETLDAIYKIRDLASNVRFVNMSDIGDGAKVVGIWKYPADFMFDVVYFSASGGSCRFVIDRVREDWLTFSRRKYEEFELSEIGVSETDEIIGPVMSHRIGGRSYVAMIQFRADETKIGTFVKCELVEGSDKPVVTKIEKTSFETPSA
jgi:hypothetical protein